VVTWQIPYPKNNIQASSIGFAGCRLSSDSTKAYHVPTDATLVVYYKPGWIYCDKDPLSLLMNIFRGDDVFPPSIDASDSCNCG